MFRKWLRIIVKKLLAPDSSSRIEYNIGKKKFHNSIIDSMFPHFIEIGENFVSGPGSIILAHDASLYIHTGYYRIEKVKIGNNVFLGAYSTVLPGVTIGNNVIVGAGSVVTKDIAPNAVYAGNPAKFICSLEEYINKCTIKNILHKAPVSYKKMFSEKPEPLTIQDIKDFQDIVIFGDAKN